MRKFKDLFAHLFVGLLAIASCALIGRSSFVTSSGTKQEQNININTNGDKAVCYIDSTKQKFTTIEKALEVAKANAGADDIYVMPGTAGAITEINVTRNCEIAAGDSLYFPFVDDGATRDWGQNRNSNINQDFADADAASVAKNRTCLVNISSGVRIANYGRVFIGGQCTTGDTQPKQVGYTYGKYVELLMHDNSLIDNYGEITLRGYIKESKNNNGSKIINNKNSKITMPFVIYDFRGGSYSTAAHKNNCCPFNIFDFPNCHSLIECNMDSFLYGAVGIYVKQPIVSDILVLSPVSNTQPSLFKMKNGKISIKYNPSNVLYTTNDTVAPTTVTKKELNYTNVFISGDAELSNIVVDIGVSVDTSKFYCPISYKFQININSGTFDVINKIKFLSGSVVTIDKGSKANIVAPVSFYNNYVPKITTSREAYPYIFKNDYAKLVNNGDLYINTEFGGMIETMTNDETAIVKRGPAFVYNTTTREILTGETGGFSYTDERHKELSSGYITSSNNIPLNITHFVSERTYTSRNGYWHLPLSSISLVMLTPDSGISAKNTAVTYNVKAIILPGENNCSNVKYNWSIDNNLTLTVDPNDNSKVTFTTPANKANMFGKDKTYTLTCRVTFTKSDGTNGEVSATGKYIATKKGGL